MTNHSPDRDPPEPAKIDLEVSQPARMGDYLVGGNANFSVDRDVIEYVTDALPGGTDTARDLSRAYLDFRHRLVTYLATEVGIRQFLDLGVGIPTRSRTHEIAQAIAPESRVVYFLNDPVGLAHAHSLLTSTPEGATAHIHHPEVEPRRILTQASETLDLTQPVAVLCLWVLTILPKEEDPYRLVNRLLARVPSGSYLAVTDLASDIHPEELYQSFERYREKLKEGSMRRMTMRSRPEVTRFFDDLELVEPGVVPIDQWRQSKPEGGSLCYMYGALGRKR